MNIHYKFIEHERFGDAPFIGALICANDCHNNCKNCFNQKIKTLPTVISTAEEIITKIKQNPFNKGVILAGLEWSEQIEEAIELLKVAKSNGLRTMFFTGKNNIDYRIKEFADYIKYGEYNEKLKTIDHIEYGVVLATSNQHILKKGINY